MIAVAGRSAAPASCAPPASGHRLRTAWTRQPPLLPAFREVAAWCDCDGMSTAAAPTADNVENVFQPTGITGLQCRPANVEAARPGNFTHSRSEGA